MLRWLCLLAGLGSIALGVIGYTMHPPIPEVALPISVEEAVALLPETGRVAVTVSGHADPSARIYPSLLEQPPYTRRRPSETHDLPAPGAVERRELESYLGSRVRFQATASGPGISLLGVEERTLQEDEVRSKRSLVALEGTGDSLWALSPTYRDGDSAAAAWLAQSTFTGVLTRLGDIGVNTATWDLEFSFNEIREFAADEYGVAIAADTLLIIDGEIEEPGSLFYLPVQGSGGELLIMPFHEGEPLPGWVESGPLTGVLWVWEVDEGERHDLERVFGGPLGRRRGVIQHDDTAVDLNRKTKFGLKLFVGLGLVLWFFSGIGFLRARRT